MALIKSTNRMTAGSWVNVLDYGAKIDGVTDDTAAWNAALATGRNIIFPEGHSRITNQISFAPLRGQCMVGSGNNSSKFLVGLDFNMAASSVIVFRAIAQQMRHVAVDCIQPTTNNRNNLIRYPWIIDCSGCPSSELHDVWISSSWNGVRMHGNCGQSVINQLKVGGFNIDLHVDGSHDTVRIDNFHSWPLGEFLADQQLMDLYYDRNRIAAQFGRVDDLDIGSLLTFTGRIIFADLSGQGPPFGIAARIALDGTTARIEMSAGRMAVSSLYGTGGILNDFKIGVTNNGWLSISSVYLFIVGTTDPQSFCYVNGPMACLSMSNVHCEFLANGRIVTCDNGATLNLSNSTFIQRDNVARTQPVIQVNSGRAVVTGNQIYTPGGGTGSFIHINVDENHVVTGNSFNGWGYLLPTAQNLGIFGPNTNVPALVSNANYNGPVRVRRMTGTLDGTGAATVNHGIVLGNERIVSLWTAYIGGAGERVPFESEYVDGSVVALNAGVAGAGRNYVVMIQFF